MRNIATLVALSLTISLPVATDTAHATTDSAPSSYVIDLLADSQIVDKELAEVESPEEFESDVASLMNALQRSSATPDPTLQQENDSEAELENLEDGIPSEAPSEEGDLEDNSNEDAVEDIQQPQEDSVQEDDAPQDEQEEPESATDTYTLLTAPLETEGFHVAGVTWDGAAPEQVDVRAYSNGEWTDWFNLEVDVSTGGSDGTDPIMAAGSEGIQVRATGDVLPASLDVHLMTGEGNSGTEEEAEPQEAQDQPAEGTELEPAENVSFSPSREENYLLSNYVNDDSAPNQLASTHKSANLKSVPFSKNIVSRTQWGGPREATWRTQYASLKGSIIHHTAGSNTYTRNQAPGIVKGIWNYHTYTRGWGDIGYNFLIDKYGTVYEGRSGSTIAKPGEMAVGAHAAPANTGSVGISVLGSYTGSVNPSNIVLDTISEVVAWQFAMAGVDPAGKFTYRNASGRNVTTNAISGHRDISATACPGNIYPRLGNIRSSAAAKMSQYKVDQDPKFVRVESSGKGWPQENAWSMGDFSGNDTTDLMLRNSSGRIVLYKGRGNNSFADGVQIGRGWNSFTSLYTGIDFDGDSNPDVLAINRSNQLFLYPGDGKGSLKNGRQIGRGWRFEHLILFDKGPKGNPAIAGITADGSMTLYSTNGRGGFLASTHIGNGYSNLIGAVAVGDWDSSGFSDVVNVNPSGRLHYFSDPTENGFTGSVQIGRGWGGLTLLPGDSASGFHDIHTVSRNGRLTTYIFSR